MEKERIDKIKADIAFNIKMLEELDLDRHLERLENDPDYVERSTLLELQQDRELLLKVKVSEPYLSSLLMSWLYQKNDRGGTIEICGCTLSEINFTGQTGSDVKRKLQEFINQLEV